jgi:hypothetical protein
MRRSLAVVLSAGLVGGLLAICGCRPPAAPKTPARLAAPADDALEAARLAFRKQTGVASCRAALQQLNALFTRTTEDKPEPLQEKTREFLADRVGLDDGELGEVASTTFTLLDAHHLDGCFLLRDAARFLDVDDLPPVERASAAFAWVVRQVRLQPDHGVSPVPPQFVLRRGRGTAAERALVFLGLLDQLGIDGCMIALPRDASDKTAFRYWLPGALVEREIYLFDPRLGLPLPGPGGQAIATLAQVRSEAAVFAGLRLDDQHAYDVTPEQAKRAEVHLACPLSAMAPRMRYLENLLAGQNKINLGIDPRALLEKFQEATKGQQIPVKFWNPPGNPTTLARVLRQFLPPDEEGGCDKVHPINLQALRGYAGPQDTGEIGIHQKGLFELELIPWSDLPEPIRNLPSRINPGLQLRDLYARVFVTVPLPPPPTDRAFQVTGPGGMHLVPERSMSQADILQRIEYYFMGQGAQQNRTSSPLHFSMSSGSPRDDLLRGRFDDATAKLVETLDQVHFQKSLIAGDADVPQKLAKWCERARRAFADLLAAERMAERSRSAASQADVEAARKALGAVWNEGISPASLNQSGGPDGATVRADPRDRLPLWLRAVLAAAAEPLGAEATYQLALCKHDQAERLRRPGDNKGKGAAAEAKVYREAWSAAGDWWRTYLEQYPTGPASAEARRGRAQALAALGDRETAAALLRDLTGTASPLEQLGRLYQARQLTK